MDDAVARLERARAAEPDDAGITVDLARAYLRVGRPLRALAVLGPLDAGEREAAGRALAAALGLEWVGIVGGSDRFEWHGHKGEPQDFVLVPAGTFTGDGERAITERRPFVPAFLADLVLLPHDDGDVPRLDAMAAAHGGRLPTAREWMKLWRGGHFLDGDESRRVPNPDPVRLLPQGTVPAVPSAYGGQFDSRASEALSGFLAGVFLTSMGRYFVPLDQAAGLRRWRVVRDVPAELG